MDMSTEGQQGPAAAKVRKPYTITKVRERWTEQEKQRFCEALKLFGRQWRKIEEYIGSKTTVQIRSHAQKYFAKVERGQLDVPADLAIPPPRPKRKAAHPYPRAAAPLSGLGTCATSTGAGTTAHRSQATSSSSLGEEGEHPTEGQTSSDSQSQDAAEEDQGLGVAGAAIMQRSPATLRRLGSKSKSGTPSPVVAAAVKRARHGGRAQQVHNGRHGGRERTPTGAARSTHMLDLSGPNAELQAAPVDPADSDLLVTAQGTRQATPAPDPADILAELQEHSPSLHSRLPGSVTAAAVLLGAASLPAPSSRHLAMSVPTRSGTGSLENSMQIAGGAVAADAAQMEEGEAQAIELLAAPVAAAASAAAAAAAAAVVAAAGYQVHAHLQHQMAYPFFCGYPSAASTAQPSMLQAMHSSGVTEGSLDPALLKHQQLLAAYLLQNIQSPMVQAASDQAQVDQRQWEEAVRLLQQLHHQQQMHQQQQQQALGGQAGQPGAAVAAGGHAPGAAGAGVAAGAGLVAAAGALRSDAHNPWPGTAGAFLPIPGHMHRPQVQPQPQVQPTQLGSRRMPQQSKAGAQAKGAGQGKRTAAQSGHHDSDGESAASEETQPCDDEDDEEASGRPSSQQQQRQEEEQGGTEEGQGTRDEDDPSLTARAASRAANGCQQPRKKQHQQQGSSRRRSPAPVVSCPGTGPGLQHSRSPSGQLPQLCTAAVGARKAARNDSSQERRLDGADGDAGAEQSSSSGEDQPRRANNAQSSRHGARPSAGSEQAALGGVAAGPSRSRQQEERASQPHAGMSTSLAAAALPMQPASSAGAASHAVLAAAAATAAPAAGKQEAAAAPSKPAAGQGPAMQPHQSQPRAAAPATSGVGPVHRAAGPGALVLAATQPLASAASASCNSCAAPSGLVPMWPPVWGGTALNAAAAPSWLPSAATGGFLAQQRPALGVPVSFSGSLPGTGTGSGQPGMQHQQSPAAAGMGATVTTAGDGQLGSGSGLAGSGSLGTTPGAAATAAQRPPGSLGFVGPAGSVTKGTGGAFHPWRAPAAPAATAATATGTGTGPAQASTGIGSSSFGAPLSTNGSGLSPAAAIFASHAPHASCTVAHAGSGQGSAGAEPAACPHQ